MSEQIARAKSARQKGEKVELTFVNFPVSISDLIER